MTSKFDTKKMSTAEGCGAFLGIMFLVVLAIAGVITFVSIIFMWAWGAFMVPVFSLSYLDFKEAFAAIVLLSTLRLGIAPIGYKKS